MHSCKTNGVLISLQSLFQNVRKLSLIFYFEVSKVNNLMLDLVLLLQLNYSLGVSQRSVFLQPVGGVIVLLRPRSHYGGEI